MPGATGNVALAAHRTTFGKPFNRLADLHVGDPVVIQTQDGWYTYRFRTLQYVQPDAVDVLLPVPQVPDVPADGQYLTMTSCSPMFSLAERIVAYSVFEVLHAVFGRRARVAPRGDRLMYAALWHVLPGPAWVRVLILLLLAAAVVYGLLTWVFPWVSTIVNPQEVTVE